MNNLDEFLCTHVDSIRRICPIVDQTSDEIIERYGDLFFLSFFNKNPKSSPVNNDFNHVPNVRKEKKFQFIEQYFQFLTNVLMIIEMYSKYIQNELNDHIDISRNLWKNLNMEDGRSLDEVEVRHFNTPSNFFRKKKKTKTNFISLSKIIIYSVRKFIFVTYTHLTCPLL